MQKLVIEIPYNNSPKNKMLYQFLTNFGPRIGYPWPQCYFVHFVRAGMAAVFFVDHLTFWAPHYQLDPKKSVSVRGTVRCSRTGRTGLRRKEPLLMEDWWSFRRSWFLLCFLPIWNNIILSFCWITTVLAWSHVSVDDYIKVFKKKIRKWIEKVR